MSIFHDQFEFLKAADAEVGTVEAEELAENLIIEEHKEFLDETYGSFEKIKESLDCIYVHAQYLNSAIGPDMAKLCWDALHSNNMSKCIDGKLVKRDDGKVLKPEGYRKLNIRDVIREELFDESKC